MFDETKSPTAMAIELLSEYGSTLQGPVRDQLKLMQVIAQAIQDAVEYGKREGAKGTVEAFADLNSEVFGLDERYVEDFTDTIYESYGITRG